MVECSVPGSLAILIPGLLLAGPADLKIPKAAGPWLALGPAGGETRIYADGAQMRLSARLPEPDRVTALSVGRDPVWVREDLITWNFTVHVNGRNRTLSLSVNPLGAYRVEPAAAVTVSARIAAGEWRVEAAIPMEALAEIGFLSIERVRAARPDAPELHWYWPAANDRAAFEIEPGWRAPGPTGSAPPSSDLRTRMAAAAAEERRAWEQVRTLADWERFRARRLRALADSLGAFPARTPLHAQVTRRADLGDGFVIENIVFESRPHLVVTANLYRPAKESGRIPAIVVVHSHHAPKTQSELQDMGMTWARAGVAVLVMDQLCAGERLQSQPWPRESYYGRYALGMQLYLAGESLMKWMVWDLMRGIDLLRERPYIDPRRIVVIGAVAGGGDPAAVTAALDERVAAVAPFNFGEAGPEEHYTDGPREYDFAAASPGWGSWESTRNLRHSAVDQFFPWLICAAVAPRPFLYSFEVGWPKGVEAEPMWARYRKVFAMYGKSERLAAVDGFGPFPGPGECTNVGVYLRKRIYPVLKRWLDIPVPAGEYHNPRPESELMCLTPAAAAARQPKAAHELAAALARERLRARPADLRAALRAKLGDIEPDRQAQARVIETDSTMERIALGGASLLLIRPRAAERLPVVVAFSQQGQARFLKERAGELERLRQAGIAVCLADVRGVGEKDRGPSGMSAAATELMLGSTMLGAHLKEARTVLAYLGGRPELDARRVAVWGDSFAPVNPRGAQQQEQAEPLGPLLALLTALYEDGVRAVAARRGLVSFLSVLEDRFCYVPLDVIVPGILEAGDIPDIAAALAPRPVLLEEPVDGRNRLAREGAPRTDVAGWLIKQIRW